MKKILGILTLCSTILIGVKFALAQVPNEYMPNFEIQADYDIIVNDLLKEIEAKTTIGQQISPATFSTLNQKFATIFPYFPQQYEFGVTYQVCLDLSAQLANAYNYNTLVNFMDNCFKDLTKIIKQVNTKYAVKADAEIGPASGPAPLTVTFDARKSTDPSDQTIPSDNFFWYFRDVNGVDKVIGNSPVLNYEFEEPGNYVVHLTVRSSNKISEGIFDGSAKFNVDVTPRTANIVVYANGQKMERTKKVKLGLQEGQRGIVLDGSATTPRWGREIIGHKRTISWPNGFSTIREGAGIPDSIRVVLPDQGEYIVAMTTTDNQNNPLTEKFSLSISDPVSIIKQTPEKGNTSVTYSFDAAASYSITSRIRLYTREIFDTDGNKTDTIQGTNIKKQFTKPGSYVVKLTVEDDAGLENSDTAQVFVESADPIPQFIIKPRAERASPSEFLLDASATSDVDVDNKVDELSYEREFSSPNMTKITQSEELNKKVVVEFNEVGKQTIKLIVTDKYAKKATITKEIEIKSTLRPKIFSAPKATTWGDNVVFKVTSDKPIANYARDFGDQSERAIQTDSILHKYNQVGVYPVKLKVTWSEGQENEISTMVFIGERQSPIAAYTVNDIAGRSVLTQNDNCTDNGQEIPAYRVDRYQKLVIDSAESVNVQWQSKDLVSWFKPQNEDIFKTTTSKFNYNFTEVGCQYIDMTLEDTAASKSSKARIWFNVVNALPTLNNLIMWFPQYGNDAGIWFQESNQQPVDILASTFDPLIIKVTATSAKDPDGQITYFQFYYYAKEDPNRVLGVKISPANIPYAFFSLPRTPGEYVFGVKMFDNDGASQASEDIIGLGPVILFPPDTNQPDIPMVVLKVDDSNTEIGEEVTFEVSSKILSNKSDFEQERVIQYDFNGDGEYDLTTKKDKVTYVYTKVNLEWFEPRASVLYRGKRGVAAGEKIIVKNGLKPRLLLTSYDKLVLFRDISIGDIAQQETCFNIRGCDTDPNYLLKKGDEKTFPLVFEYPEYDTYITQMDLIDSSANTATKRRPIVLSPITGNVSPIHMLSIPELSITDWADTTVREVFVGENLNNTVTYYIKYSGAGTCFVDTNIEVDSDKDSNKENDKDFLCNKVANIAYEPQFESVIGRVYYDDAGKTISEEFYVSFIDFTLKLTEEKQAVYELITQILATLDIEKWDNKHLRDLLLSLRSSLVDDNDSKALVVSIDDKIKSNAVVLSETEKEAVSSIIDKLKDRSVSAAIGETVYTQSKSEILSLMPMGIKEDVNQFFLQFESATALDGQTLQDIQKQILQQMIDKINTVRAASSDNIQENQIDPTDIDTTIMPNVCSIMEFHSIPSKLCWSDDLQEIPENTTTVGWVNSVVKIILTIAGIGIGIFVVLVLIFAIKAKLKNKDEDDAGEEYIVSEPSPAPAATTPSASPAESVPTPPPAAQ